MPVTLRNYEFTVNNGVEVPLSGATVQYYANSPVHPNPNSPIGSTFVNASGMWEFIDLPDGVYDVKVSGNREKWYKGNCAFSFIAQSPLAVSAASPVLNGGFNHWQRGVSFVSPASGAYLADHWQHVNTSAAVATYFQSTDVPPVAALVPQTNYSLHLDVTTADAAVAAGDVQAIVQPIEGWLWLPFGQKQLTIGFWTKETLPGTYCVSLRNGTPNRSCVMEYTVTAADTWEYKTVTFPASGVVSVANGWNLTTGVGAYLAFCKMAGSTFQTTPGVWQTGNFYGTANQINALNSTANNSRIWGVTIGLGTTVQPFWPRLHPIEMNLLLRYAWNAGNSGMYISNSTSTLQAPLIPFPVPMRIAPTLVGGTFSANAGSPGSVGVYTLQQSYAHLYNPSSDWTISAVISLSAGVWSAEF